MTDRMPYIQDMTVLYLGYCIYIVNTRLERSKQFLISCWFIIFGKDYASPIFELLTATLGGSLKISAVATPNQI